MSRPDPDYMKKYMREYRKRNGEKMRENDRLYRQANLERLREQGREYARAHPVEARERHKRRFNELRVAVFDHYGQLCACCETVEKLVIDHINGDGAQHRQELFGHRPAFKGKTASTYSFYLWLVNNDFPEGFQVLCLRCNTSKGNTEKCRLRHQEVDHF